MIILNSLINCHHVYCQKLDSICKITGSIRGIDKGVLLVIDEETDSILKEEKIERDHFYFNLELPTANRFLFRILPANINFQAILEPGEVEIKVDTSKTQWFGNRGIQNDTWGLIWDIDQSGTPTINDWFRMKKETEFENFRELSQSLNKQLDKLKTNEDSIEIIQDKVNELYFTMIERWKEWISEFIKNNPGSPSGPFILMGLLDFDKEPNLNFYNDLKNILIEKATLTPQYYKLKKTTELLSNSISGKQIPSFTLLQVNNQPFSIDSFSGKYILLDFWASWCAPCRAAIPKWKKVFNSYSIQGLEIVGISTDKDLLAWKRALLKENMSWVQVVDNSLEILNNKKLLDYYRIQSIPFYILIGPDKKIIRTDNDSESMIITIQEIFKQ